MNSNTKVNPSSSEGPFPRTTRGTPSLGGLPCTGRGAVTQLTAPAETTLVRGNATGQEQPQTHSLPLGTTPKDSTQLSAGPDITLRGETSNCFVLHFKNI